MVVLMMVVLMMVVLMMVVLMVVVLVMVVLVMVVLVMLSWLCQFKKKACEMRPSTFNVPNSKALQVHTVLAHHCIYP